MGFGGGGLWGVFRAAVFWTGDCASWWRVIQLVVAGTITLAGGPDRKNWGVCAGVLGSLGASSFGNCSRSRSIAATPLSVNHASSPITQINRGGLKTDANSS